MAETGESELISFGRRVAMLAAAHPEKTAVVFVDLRGQERSVTWQQFDRNANRFARQLAATGVQPGDVVAVGLKNSPEHLMVSHAVWRLGACVLPMRAELPDAERDGMLKMSRASAVVSDWDGVGLPQLRTTDLAGADVLLEGPLPDRISQPGKAIGSGGSTGLPKVIVDPRPWANSPGGYIKGIGAQVGMRGGQVQLVAGPFYHNSPFCWSHWGLFEDHTLIVMAKFDAALAVDLIERHRVNWGFLVPTMMHRMIRLDGIHGRDFTSVHAFWHSAAPCPPWLKRAWLELLGPERLYEPYGSTEGAGSTCIRGDEWLLRPGSVGRPTGCDLRILDPDGNPLPTGTIGEVSMRPHSPGPTYRYLGAAPARATPDGFVGVGDLGWVDEDGYLYLADRRTDLIISGGANIYPAEVEATLMEHPGVADAAVVGIPDDEWGKRVCAVIQPTTPAAPPGTTELDAYCRRCLASYKVPKEYHFVEILPRDPSGKIRRSDLALAYTQRSAKTSRGLPAG